VQIARIPQDFAHLPTAGGIPLAGRHARGLGPGVPLCIEQLDVRGIVLGEGIGRLPAKVERDALVKAYRLLRRQPPAQEFEARHQRGLARLDVQFLGARRKGGRGHHQRTQIDTLYGIAARDYGLEPLVRKAIIYLRL